MDPIFSKRLSRTDHAHRLAVPSKVLRYLPSFGGGQRAVSLSVEDEEGRRWVFRLRIRSGKYKKPELSTGWLHFVRSKNLTTGDEIQFFMEQDEATGVIKYKIKVMKSADVRPFGAVIGYVPCPPSAEVRLFGAVIGHVIIG